MTLTIALFTEPFTVGDKTWPPLVERVPGIDPPREIHDLPKDDEHKGLRLIRAAHEWVVKQRVPFDVGVVQSHDAWCELKRYAETAEPRYLVHACHLIQDALETADA